MSEFRKITSREYKVMLNQHLLHSSKRAAAALWRELIGCAERIKSVKHEGEFDRTQNREIVFLDTPDGTISRNGFILRKRKDPEQKKPEYTLKCRSPDRLMAAEAPVGMAKGAKGKTKFEEDIGAPFISRYSRSTTVKSAKDVPKSLKDAASVFPALAKLICDGRRCAPETKICPTRSLAMYERVHTGPYLIFGGVSAEIAVILWSTEEKGRPVIAELSFRYATSDQPSNETAKLAMQFFYAIQRLDWCLPEGRTKTQFAYEGL